MRGWARDFLRVLRSRLALHPHSIARRRAIFQRAARGGPIGRLLWDVSPTIKGTEFDRRYRRVMEESARERSSRSYSALRPDRYHQVRAFPFGSGVGVAFSALDITMIAGADMQALRDRELELARVQRIGGVGGLEVDLADGFRSLRSPEHISAFMAFPSARSTKRTSSGSSAFILTIESGLRSTFWPRSQALTGTTKPNIV